MKRAAIFALPLFVWFAGCATAPRQVLSTPARTVVVTAFEPVVRGVNVGTTVFQNRDWKSSPDGFDANALANEAITKTLTQTLPVIDGRTCGLALQRAERFVFNDPTDVELSQRLVELGRERNIDRIVLLATGTAPDWIAGINQPLTGMGLYRREFLGMKRIQVYGVFQLRVFDCRTQTFTATDTVPGAQEVYAVEWHESWAEFPIGEQRRVITAYTEILTGAIGQLLTRAGLANVAPPPERSIAERLIKPQRPKSWLPDGNRLPIPEGVPPARARSAIVHGLKSRGWTVLSEGDQEVVGFHANKDREVRVIARLTATEITLVPDDREMKSDGTTVAISPHARWHRNLKESIYRDLLDAEGTEAEHVESR